MWSPLGEGSHARHQSQLKPFTLHGGDRARPTSLGLISLSLSRVRGFFSASSVLAPYQVSR